MFGTQQFDSRIQIVALVGAVVLMAVAVELVRRRRLGEVYSIVWLALGGVVTILALFRNLQEIVARWVGVYYPPSLIFGTLIFLQLGVMLYLSVALTRLEAHNRILTQRLALLEHHALYSHEENEGEQDDP
jgi:hypothetical protein